METVSLFPDSWLAWIQAALSLVGAASAVAAATPTPKDDKIIGKIYRVVNVLALNVGFAKNNSAN
ncbi:MAG: hypothetical protein GC184_06775 [Rhizobiales bacterium]|nr:hypothetical protein [Hyphomicrobiales bacterium]